MHIPCAVSVILKFYFILISTGIFCSQSANFLYTLVPHYNALFGEYTYDQDKGVVPLNRIDGAKHLIKSFSSYDNSVSSYFKNINSHNAYREFRNVRRIMRSKNNFSDINLLIKNLNSYAEDDNYINTLKIVIQKNNFNSFNSKTISY